MEVSTLRSMTTELNGRSVNPALASHLSQYAREVAGVLAAARAAAEKFPAELAPSAVFALKPEPPTK